MHPESTNGFERVSNDVFGNAVNDINVWEESHHESLTIELLQKGDTVGGMIMTPKLPAVQRGQQQPTIKGDESLAYSSGSFDWHKDFDSSLTITTASTKDSTTVSDSSPNPVVQSPGVHLPRVRTEPTPLNTIDFPSVPDFDYPGSLSGLSGHSVSEATTTPTSQRKGHSDGSKADSKSSLSKKSSFKLEEFHDSIHAFDMFIKSKFSPQEEDASDGDSETRSSGRRRRRRRRHSLNDTSDTESVKDDRSRNPTSSSGGSSSNSMSRVRRRRLSVGLVQRHQQSSPRSNSSGTRRYQRRYSAGTKRERRNSSDVGSGGGRERRYSNEVGRRERRCSHTDDSVVREPRSSSNTSRRERRHSTGAKRERRSSTNDVAGGREQRNSTETRKERLNAMDTGHGKDRRSSLDTGNVGGSGGGKERRSSLDSRREKRGSCDAKSLGISGARWSPNKPPEIPGGSRWSPTSTNPSELPAGGSQKRRSSLTSRPRSKTIVIDNAPRQPSSYRSSISTTTSDDNDVDEQSNKTKDSKDQKGTTYTGLARPCSLPNLAK